MYSADFFGYPAITFWFFSMAFCKIECPKSRGHGFEPQSSQPLGTLPLMQLSDYSFANSYSDQFGVI